MRKLFIILFSLFLPHLAIGAGYGHLNGALNHQYLSLSSKIIKSNNVSYCTYSGQNGTDEETLSLFFKAAFTRWTLGVADYIEKAGRTKEFPYAMQILKKSIDLKYLGQCSKQNNTADIALVSDIEGCEIDSYSHYAGYYEPVSADGRKAVNFPALNAKSVICIAKKFSEKKTRANFRISTPIELNLLKISKKRYQKVTDYINSLAKGITAKEPEDLYYFDVFRTMTHEVGHAMGLADEYSCLAATLHTNRSSTSPYRGNGMMNVLHLITADDINGIITLLYSLSAKKISFKPFGEAPGMIINNKFVLPVEEFILSEEDEIKLKKSLRISQAEYNNMMKKYSKILDTL